MKYLAAIAMIAIPLAFRRRPSFSGLGALTTDHFDRSVHAINDFEMRIANDERKDGATFPNCKERLRNLFMAGNSLRESWAHYDSIEKNEISIELIGEEELNDLKGKIEIAKLKFKSVTSGFYPVCLKDEQSEEQETEKERLIRFFKHKLPPWKPGDPL